MIQRYTLSPLDVPSDEISSLVDHELFVISRNLVIAPHFPIFAPRIGDALYRPPIPRWPNLDSDHSPAPLESWNEKYGEAAYNPGFWTQTDDKRVIGPNLFGHFTVPQADSLLSYQKLFLPSREMRDLWWGSGTWNQNVAQTFSGTSSLAGALVYSHTGNNIWPGENGNDLSLRIFTIATHPTIFSEEHREWITTSNCLASWFAQPGFSRTRDQILSTGAIPDEEMSSLTSQEWGSIRALRVNDGVRVDLWVDWDRLHAPLPYHPTSFPGGWFFYQADVVVLQSYQSTGYGVNRLRFFDDETAMQ